MYTYRLSLLMAFFLLSCMPYVYPCPLFSSSAPPPPLLHLHSFYPFSAQVDRCLAHRPVIITVVLCVSRGQDRTFPGAMGDGRRNEENKQGGQEKQKYVWIVLRFFLYVRYRYKDVVILVKEKRG